MKRHWLILIVLLVFVGTLIAQAPAPLIARLVQPKNGPPLLYGADGTLAQGSAAGINLSGRLFNESLRWQFQPWWLALGRVAFHIAGTGTVAADGGVQLTFGGLHLKNFSADGGLKDLAGAGGFAFVPADGRVKLQLAALRISDGLPRSAEGQLDILSLRWTLARTPVQLGSFRAQLKNDGDAIVADISSTDGPLNASGTARLLPATRRYELDLTLQPKAQGAADQPLSQLLHGLGAPDPQGKYHLRTSGPLP